MSRYTPPADLYPFKSHWLERPGGRLHYLDEGPADAPPVLMLHGNPTWSFYYREVVKSLRDRYRCIVPDHLGCGLSDKPDDAHYDYRLASRIEDVQALMAHLDIQQPLRLIVHDWGGMIGFGWATMHPVNIERCVVLNTAAFPMPASKRFPWALWLAGKTPLGTPLVRGLNAFSGIASRVAFKKPVSPAVRKAYTGPYDNWANRIATLRFVQDIPLRETDPGYDIVSATARGLQNFADTPCLLGWGMQDFVFDHHFLSQWQAHLPHAETVRYPDCGHYVLEDAGSDLIQRISHFMDEPDNALEHG